MANTDIPTATAVPMINCVMLLFCMIASQCNRLQQTIAVACSKHVTNVTTRERFPIFARSPLGGPLPFADCYAFTFGAVELPDRCAEPQV
jgi:hypothetical protein